MLERRFGSWTPRFLLRLLMGVETQIEDAVKQLAAETSPSARVLDGGAGEGRHASSFAGHRYVGVDLGIGDGSWDYSGVDAAADLEALPFPDGVFDAALNIVVLEHTRDPQRVLQELSRVLKPGGRLLLIAPQQWEVHQHPHDYFRFTRFGLQLLLARSGLQTESLDPIGGYFVLLGRRLVAALNYFQDGLRWLAFPFVAAVVLPLGLILPLLDSLDSKKDFTLAYRCLARKP